MPGGRPRKPTRLKMVEGTARPDRINKEEPEPPVGSINPPVRLKGKGRAAWKRLAPMLTDMRVATAMDEEALTILCDAIGEYYDAREAIKKEGRTYVTYTETGSKMIRPHPEIANASDAWRRVQRMMVEFGLTPSSRSKVHAGPEKEEDPFEAFLNGRK